MDEAALADFAAALRDPDHPVPPGLRAWNGSDPAPRLAVHRNTVTVSLLQALREAFPVLRLSLGAEAFDALALAQVRQDPPTSPVLARYGQRWVAALARQPRAACPAWVVDLARLEQARIDAWHAPDAPALDAAELARRTADPQRLAGARLRLHPSLRLLRLDARAVACWQRAHAPAVTPPPHAARTTPGRAHTHGPEGADDPHAAAGARPPDAGTDIDAPRSATVADTTATATATATASATALASASATSEAPADDPFSDRLTPPVHLLLLRDPQDRVPLLPLPAADAALLQALQQGSTLGAAMTAAGRTAAPHGTTHGTTHEAPPDLAQLLALLLRHGALVDWLDDDPTA